MDKFKGIIALDIDGTITAQKHMLEPEVATYLNKLMNDGWRLIFITGRTFSFAKPILSSLAGPYAFAVQNGATLYQMPGEVCLVQHRLSTTLLPALAPIFAEHTGGLLVESGKENGDICYYCPDDFDEEEKSYLDFRIKMSPETWVPCKDLSSLPVTHFAAGKYFAPHEKAHELQKQISEVVPIEVMVIRDPFRPSYHLAHLTAQGASKGAVLEAFKQYAPNLPILAAGDDFNDEEMLEKAHVKVVMENAPKRLLALADVIAPEASKQGIIQGLEEGIWKLQSK